jgi:hypothetical protein
VDLLPKNKPLGHKRKIKADETIKKKYKARFIII